MPRFTHLLTPAALALTLTVAGCGDQEEAPAPPTPAEAPAAPEAPAPPPAPEGALPTFVPALEVDVDASTRTATGLMYRDLTVGDGAEAGPGKVVRVHYTGWLPDGSEFDSSRPSGEPIEFPLGQGIVVPGWEEGLTGMRAGGRRQLIIPPDLGYGATGSPPAIPPNSYLVFDVEMMDVQ